MSVFSYIGYNKHIQCRLRLLHDNQLRYHCRQKETFWCKFFPILGITNISKVASDFFTTISYDIIADRKKHPGVSFSYIGYYNHIKGSLRLLHDNQLRYHFRQKETSWCKFFFYIGYYNHIKGSLRLRHDNQLRYHCRQKETSWCKFFPILGITNISKVASDFSTTISYDIIADRKKHPGVSFFLYWV